ncbi:MAG: lytic transglycosylase domain-containing protein [Desulfobulbaceae bacterium]|nr:lytic transglycosylase domain-containing protein [Desulfobulbaceae bacterium]
MGIGNCYLISALLLVLMVPGRAAAELYCYVDKNGQRHFTNAPVDSRYKPFSLSSSSYSRNIMMTPWGVSGVFDVTEYDKYIESAAKQFQIDSSLLKAIIVVESSFNPRAVSKKGAKGLMQLMPKTARELRVTDPFDPRQNIFGGTRYLRQLLNLFEGNLPLSLAAYNAGPTRVTKDGTIPAITETRNYVRRVLSYYDYYQRDESKVTSTIKVSNLVTVN